MGFARAQWWLMTLARYLFFDGDIESYCRGRDLQRSWMLRRQRVWGLLQYRAFIISLDLGVDLSKLLLVESPKTRIAWHLMPWTIRFDFLASCSYENLVSSLLPFRTSPTAAVLAIYWTMIKPCVVLRFFSCCCFYFFVVGVVVFCCCCCCSPRCRVLCYDVCHFCPPLCRVVMGFVISSPWFSSISDEWKFSIVLIF